MGVQTLRLGGGDSTWTELHTSLLQAKAVAPGHESVCEATVEALNAPLGFPPLSRAVTPDDQVAIALGEGVPAAASVVEGIVRSLADCEISAAQVAVVTTQAHVEERLRGALGALCDAGLILETHDPDDEESLCFAGLTHSDRQLKLNRRLFDADLLLPVWSARARDGVDESPFAGVYPMFGDRETIQRFTRVRSVLAASDPESNHATVRRAELREAGWMIGAPMVLAVAPAVSGEAPTVLAGDPVAVAEGSNAACREAWSAPAPEPAQLVVAVLGGDAAVQTWGDVGRALQSAERIREPGGVVALWSDLDEPVGEAMAKLTDAEDLGQVIGELGELSGEEAWAAWQLAQALERGPVFFHSRHDADTLERLGVAPVGTEKELERLAQRHASGAVLQEAQHVWFD